MKRAYPPFSGRGDGAWRRTDYYTEKGAHALARIIKAAWTAAGHDIRVDVVPVSGYVGGLYTVRMPDLVNGLPVKQVPA